MSAHKVANVLSDTKAFPYHLTSSSATDHIIQPTMNKLTCMYVCT